MQIPDSCFKPNGQPSSVNIDAKEAQASTQPVIKSSSQHAVFEIIIAIFVIFFVDCSYDKTLNKDINFSVIIIVIIINTVVTSISSLETITQHQVIWSKHPAEPIESRQVDWSEYAVLLDFHSASIFRVLILNTAPVQLYIMFSQGHAEADRVNDYHAHPGAAHL